MEEDDVQRLKDQISALEAEVVTLREELEETNRGVVALYAELDEQAEQLRRANSKFLAVYERAPTGIALLTPEGRIAEANPAMAQLLGTEVSELQGNHLQQYVDGRWVDFLEEVPGTADIDRREVSSTRPDGSVVRLEWSAERHIDGDLSMVLAVDVSQRAELARLRAQWLERERTARAEAEQLSRGKDDFIAMVAHELRSPLTAITGWTEVFRRKAPADLQRGVDAIVRSCSTQSRMISDLLDVSRLRLGKLAMTMEPLDLADAIEQDAEALRTSVEERGVGLKVTTDAEGRQALADPARIQQVIWNLLTNALKFTPQGGTISVDVRCRDGFLEVAVSDTGQGMRADFLPLVFERFAQGDAGSNRQRGGLGLGLAIVKQIVDAHGGSISAESEGLGKGSTFRFRLPLMQTPSAIDAKLDLDPSAFPLSGLDILVVEDDDEASRVLAVVLVDRGATARVARDAEAALELMEARRPDVLVSDIGLPGLDGLGLIRDIRQRERTEKLHRLPAIAVTAFTRDIDRQHAFEAGFDAHCGKPIKPLEVVREIAMLVRTG